MVAARRGYANSLGGSEGQEKVISKLNLLHENKIWLEFHFRSTFLPTYLGQTEKIMLMIRNGRRTCKALQKLLNKFLGQFIFILVIGLTNKMVILPRFNMELGKYG